MKSPPAAAPMTPGTYLRKRREAAGVSLDLAAVAFVPFGRPPVEYAHQKWAVRPDDELLTMVRMIAHRIDELENDLWVVDRSFTTVLARVVHPLDVEIYDALVALQFGVNVPLPQVCRSCGCSWHRPCFDAGKHIGCAWSDTDPALCTACEARAAAAPEQGTADAS